MHVSADGNNLIWVDSSTFTMNVLNIATTTVYTYSVANSVIMWGGAISPSSTRVIMFGIYTSTDTGTYLAEIDFSTPGGSTITDSFAYLDSGYSQ